MKNFEKIYNLYFEDVYRFILTLSQNKVLAEEITQETFFKALKNIDKFRGNCKIKVWLCQIAKNTYYSHQKHQKRYVYDEPPKLTDNNFESILYDREQAFEIHKALHCMDEPYKEVFTLRVFGELSFKQICEIFEKTESWARVTFYRAKQKIQNLMKGEQ